MIDQKRTSISLSGIVKYAKRYKSLNGKDLVTVILEENVSGKDQPAEYVAYQITAVGDAAQTLIAAMNANQLPTGNGATQIATLYTKNVKPGSKKIQAQNNEYKGGKDVLEGDVFNANLLSFTAFNAEINVFNKKVQQQVPAAPQAPAQEQPQAAQQAPIDDFDDDVPF